LLFHFANCSLDLERREFRRGDRLVEIEPQVFDLLVYLVRNRDHVVTKDDMIAGVWNGRIVSDSTLTSRITAARKAIGDSGEQQALIRTVPRKGLRFVGDVAESNALSAQELRHPDAEQPLGLERGHGFLGESCGAVDCERVLRRDIRRALRAHLEITRRGADDSAARFRQQLSFH